MKPSLRAPAIVLPAVFCLSLTGVVGLAGVIGPVPAGAAPSRFTCAGTVTPLIPEPVPAGTYASLTMPPGSLCTISGAVTVNHPVTLGTGSGLGLVGGTLIVNGKVTVGSRAAFGDLFGFYPITVNGSVFVESNGDLAVLGGTIAGSVLATAPSSLTMYTSQVSGKVSIAGGGGSNPVLDAIHVTQYEYVDLEGNVISGPVTETGFAGPGSQYGFGGAFLGNRTGPMTLRDDSVVPIAVESNVINGPATCSGNTPVPVDFGASTVTGPIKGDQGADCFG